MYIYIQRERERVRERHEGSAGRETQLATDRGQWDIEGQV